MGYAQLVGLWALALSIPLVIRADGKSIRLELAFIPLWFIDAVILLAAIIAVVKISLEGHDDDEDRFWRKVCFIVMMLVSGLSVRARSSGAIARPQALWCVFRRPRRL